MGGADKALEVFGSAIVLVDALEILCPVAVVTTFSIYEIC